MEAGASTYERARKNPLHPQAALRGGKARKTPVPARRRGDRRLRHDPGGRPRHGVPLRRQGQLRAARRALEAARALAGLLRPHRRQPGPAPPRVPRACAARLPRLAGRSLPHRGAGYLFRGEAHRPRRRDDVRAVLAPAPRRPLSRRARGRRDQDRARAPPRRHPGDVFPQPLLRRQDEGHGAEAAVRRRRTRRHPAARLRRRSRPRSLRQGAGIPDRPVRSLRLAADAAAEAGQGDAARLGKAPSRPGGIHVPRAFGSRALAPHGPEALRFRRGARDRKNVWRRRQGVRLERRTWNITERRLPAPSTLPLSAPLNEMKPSRSICKTGNETSMRRHVGIVGIILVVGAVALAAAMAGRVTAQDWRNASQERVGLAPDPATARDPVVQVYAARVIGWQGVFGVHTWIAVKPAAAAEYTVYEIIGWRLRSQDTALVVRHRAPDMRWFGSAPELVAEKRGADVEELIARIHKAPRSYPLAGEYTMWPGPNSNTFTAWVLRAVPELEADLRPTAIGKDYSGRNLVGPAPSGHGFQLSLFGLAAFTASAVEGFEVNLLGLSFGINPFDPSLKLPLVGRVGAARAFASKADEGAAHKPGLLPDL